MRKPDRFQKMVEQVAHGPKHYRNVLHDDVIMLLRREQARVVRFIKRQPHYLDKSMGLICRYDLVAALKGKP